MRIKIGSGFGVPVYLHWSFIFLPLLIFWMHSEESPFSLPAMFAVMGLAFVCVVLHEFGHILMARRFGIGTEDVTLYPIGGVARLRKMTDKPFEEFLIAIAGPAVNVAIAIFLLAFVVLPMIVFDFVYSSWHAPSIFDSVGAQIVLGLLWFNFIMVPFNLLPAFPMDGGRVLRALLSAWLGPYQGTQIAVGVGFFFCILLGIAGAMLGNYLIPVLAMFVIMAGQQELMMVRMKEQHRLRRQQGMVGNDQYDRLEEGAPLPQTPMFIYQPTISVYTWDNQTGTWRQEASPSA